MLPEEKARVKIDEKLSKAGWYIVDRDEYVPQTTSAIREALTQGNKESDYLFLSPIFDSISKMRYRSAFSHEELQRAADTGIIDNRVVALGGVTYDKIAYLESLHFGGVAMSGALWTTHSLK